MAKKNTDTVKAMLTPGEFVIKRSSARKIGYDKLEKANETGELSHMNKGGKVKTKKKEAKMPQGQGTYGSKVGRPPKKAKGYKKGGKVKKGWFSKLAKKASDTFTKDRRGLLTEEQQLKRAKKYGSESVKKAARKGLGQKVKSSEIRSKSLKKSKKEIQKKILDPSWKKHTALAKKSGENLSDLIKQRNAAKKGTDAYAKAQNKINKIYGSKKVHSRTSTGLKKLGETKKKLGKSKPSKEKMAEAYKLPEPPPKKKFERVESWETIKKMQDGGKVGGRYHGYSEGGQVTSEGYPVHGGDGNYKVGE